MGHRWRGVHIHTESAAGLSWRDVQIAMGLQKVKQPTWLGAEEGEVGKVFTVYMTSYLCLEGWQMGYQGGKEKE